MKAFRIRFNEKTIHVNAKFSMNTIHVTENNGDSRLYVGAIDRDQKERSIWYDFLPLKEGDEIEIKLVETNAITQPEKIVRMEGSTRRKSKLEIFKKLENDLKNRGIL